MFSEENLECPRCRTSMRLVLEVLGYFPRSTDQPFLTLEDFMAFQTELEEKLEEPKEEIKISREIEFNISEE